MLYVHSSVRRRCTLAAAIPMLCLVAGASAQISYEARTRFALGHGSSPTPLTEPLVVTQPGTIEVTFQMGIFDAVGFNNFGVGLWMGSIYSSEPFLSLPAQPRVAPFNSPFGNDGDVDPEGTRIGLPGRRTIEPVRGDYIVSYNEGEPIPGPPPPAGVEEYVSLYRFFITVDDVSTQREITITAEGINWPLEGYFLMQHVEPNPETGAPGMVHYTPDPVLGGPGPAQPAQLSLLTLRIIPAPTAGLTLATISFGACCRRRRMD